MALSGPVAGLVGIAPSAVLVGGGCSLGSGSVPESTRLQRRPSRRRFLRSYLLVLTVFGPIAAVLDARSAVRHRTPRSAAQVGSRRLISIAASAEAASTSAPSRSQPALASPRMVS